MSRGRNIGATVEQGKATASTPKAFHKPMTAQEAVLKELRRRLLEGELRPGAQIVQDALAEELGVSRVPVREALRILEGEGQISYAPHRGYFVTELDFDELAEIYRLRHLLENEALAMGIPATTDEDVARMAQAIKDMDAASHAEDIVALTEANRRFHFTMFALSGMTRLVRILGQLWDASDPYRSLYFSDPKNIALMAREHEAIFKAVVARDPALVIRLMDEHRAHAVPALRRALRGEQRTP